MKIINLEQNSKDWVTWRKRGIGASDMPVIMGDSPWTSKFELWAQKTGLMKRPEPNEYQKKAMDRGHRLEPVARALFEKEYTTTSFPPACAQHSNFEHLKVSFDGYSAVLNAGIEIKAPSKEDHKKALKNKIPDKYKAQVQYQMMIANSNTWYYVSYHDDYEGKESLAVIPVKPDLQYQAELQIAAAEFWNLVVTKTPPTVTTSEMLEVLVTINKQLLDLQNTQKLVELTLKALK